MTGIAIAQRIYDYENLAQAYKEVVGYADEEKIINLQNHLIWGTYKSDNYLDDLILVRAVLRVVLPAIRP